MPEEIQEVQEQEVQEIDPQIVEKAQRMGWIPPEQFKGSKDNFVPADQYVKRAEEMMPIMKTQLNKYDEKVQKYESEIMGLKSTLDAQKKTTEKLVKMSKTISERAYEQAKRDLVKQQAQAVSEGDVEKWQALEDQKEKLERPEPVEMEKEPVQQNPVFDQWHQNNDWYIKDADMTIWANGYAQQIQSQSPNMPYDQVLKTVETKAKQVFSHKFENPRREDPAPVDSSSGAAEIKPAKKSYNNLPADAKAACENVVAQGLMTKEEYVKEYFSEE